MTNIVIRMELQFTGRVTEDENYDFSTKMEHFTEVQIFKTIEISKSINFRKKRMFIKKMLKLQPEIENLFVKLRLYKTEFLYLLPAIKLLWNLRKLELDIEVAKDAVSLLDTFMQNTTQLKFVVMNIHGIDQREEMMRLVNPFFSK